MSDTIQKPGYLAEIEDLGIAYTEVAQYDLETLDKSRRIQVREFGTAPGFAPKAEAARYAVQMAHSVFPPIIVTNDGWIVDGNTRVEGRHIRKEKFHPAIVLDVSFEKGAVEDQDRLYALATTLNMQNGRSLSTKEQRAAIVTLINLGWNNAQIEKRTGIKGIEVNKVRRIMQARERLTAAGITSNGNFSMASLAALGEEKTLLLNDEPYKALAALAIDAGFTAKEVKDLAKESLALGSDTDKLARIGEVRGEYKEQIEAVKFDQSPKPPVARQLRQHLGFVVKYEDNPAALVERNGEFAESHVEYLTKAISVLNRVLAAQKEA